MIAGNFPLVQRQRVSRNLRSLIRSHSRTRLRGGLDPLSIGRKIFVRSEHRLLEADYVRSWGETSLQPNMKNGFVVVIPALPSGSTNLIERTRGLAVDLETLQARRIFHTVNRQVIAAVEREVDAAMVRDTDSKRKADDFAVLLLVAQTVSSN